MSGVSFDLALWAPESTTGLFSAKCNVPPHCRQDECTLGGFPSRTGQKKRPVGTTGKLITIFQFPSLLSNGCYGAESGKQSFGQKAGT